MALIECINMDLCYFGSEETNYKRSEAAFIKWRAAHSTNEVKDMIKNLDESPLFKPCFSPNFLSNFLKNLKESPTIF